MLRDQIILALLLLVNLGPAVRADPYRGAGDPLAQPTAIVLDHGKVVLVPHAQYFARIELDGGKDFRPGRNNDFTGQRARFGSRVELFGCTTLFVQLQDVRRWGEERDTLADYSADGIDLHQAWAELRAPSLGVRARVGRQEWAYDGHRLIGNVPWTLQARSFDGLQLALERPRERLHLLWAKLREPDQGRTEPTQQSEGDLLALWGNSTRFAALQPSLYLLYDRDSVLGRDRLTTGAYLKGSPLAGLSYEAEFYYQAGRSAPSTATRVSIAALLAGLRLNYSFGALPGKPQLGGFFDYLSGDHDPASGTLRCFDTLFATNHKFYGFADFFLNIPADTQGRGLIDVGGRLTLRPLPALHLLLDVHDFQLAAPIAVDGRRWRHVGQEVDLVVTYEPALAHHLSVQAGLSGVFPQQAGGCVARGGPDCRTRASGGPALDPEWFAYTMINLAFN